jgi:hypothetical protein
MTSQSGGIALRLVGEHEKAVESVVPNGTEINRDANETDDDRVPREATLPRIPGDQPAKWCQDVHHRSRSQVVAVVQMTLLTVG